MKTLLVELRDHNWAGRDLQYLLKDFDVALLYGDREYAIAAVTLRDCDEALNALKDVAKADAVLGAAAHLTVLDSDTVAQKEIWTNVDGLDGTLVYNKRGSLSLETETYSYNDDGDDIYAYYSLIVKDGSLMIAE